MCKVVFALAAAAALAGLHSPAVADVASDMAALRDEIDARIGSGNLGECGGRGGSALVGMRDKLQAMITGATTGELRSVINETRICYPKEYKANTPGDISDLTDQLVPVVIPALRADLVARLAFVDGQIELGKSCGHRGNPDGAKRLAAMSKLGHAKLKAADAAATDVARYGVYEAVLWGSSSRVYAEHEFGDYPALDWLPPDDGEISRLSAKIAPAGPSLAASDDPNPPPDEPNYGLGTMTASLTAGVLTIHATFTDDWTGNNGGEGPQPIIDLDLVVDGVTREGKYGASAIRTGTVTFSTYTGEDDADQNPIFDEDTYDFQGGSLKVQEFCTERISGVFTLRFKARAADNETGDDVIFTMKKGKFTVHSGV